MQPKTPTDLDIENGISKALRLPVRVFEVSDRQTGTRKLYISRDGREGNPLGYIVGNSYKLRLSCLPNIETVVFSPDCLRAIADHIQPQKRFSDRYNQRCSFCESDRLRISTPKQFRVQRLFPKMFGVR